MKNDPASIAYWYPRLKDLDIPTPETVIVDASGVELWDLIDGKTPKGFIEFVKRIEKAAENIGGFPIFLRTGHTSGKHGYAATCRVPAAWSLPARIARLVDESGAADVLGLPVDTWAVRQLLELDALFLAFEDLPIAPEFRVFIDHGAIACVHPYWPEEAIRKPNLREWRELLRDAYANTDTKSIRELAARVADGFDDYWSVDFAPSKGQWFVIDMAPGARSWHPDHRQS